MDLEVARVFAARGRHARQREPRRRTRLRRRSRECHTINLRARGHAPTPLEIDDAHAVRGGRLTAAHWLLHTDAGLLARVAAGTLIFAALAFADLRRRGRAATRWREYAVLLAAVAAALAYGAVNDQVTVSISPEYFLQAKELAQVVGDPPRSAVALRWEAAKVGLKATWSAGLLIGVVLLLANNPWGTLPRLPNRRLVATLPIVLIAAAGLGVLGGALGYAGVMTNWSTDFQDIVRADLWRPRRFMAAWGVHLGGYVGGLVGTVIAVVAIVSARRRLPRLHPGGFEVGPVHPASERER
jgi:hypothetical protein